MAVAIQAVAGGPMHKPNRVMQINTPATSVARMRFGATASPRSLRRQLYGFRCCVRRCSTVTTCPVCAKTTTAPRSRKPGSAGRAALNVETRVVNDDGVDVAAGEVGEIVHRSPQLLSGYFRDVERSNAAFAGGWFHSGDLATIDSEGYITVVDRKKDVIKSGGENVASREVEEVLYAL
jgi:fatty-acyl-CoA synthase